MGMKYNTEIRQEGGYWTLYVNGQRTVQRESFTVCDRVREALEHPAEAPYPSECYDVAESIRNWIRGPSQPD